MRVRDGIFMLMSVAVCLEPSSAASTRILESRPRGVLRGSIRYHGPAEGTFEVCGDSGLCSLVSVKGLCQFLTDDGWLVDIAVADHGGATVGVIDLATGSRRELSAARFRAPSLSPDGSQCAFMVGDSLVMAHLASSRTRRAFGGLPYALGWHGEIAIAEGGTVRVQRDPSDTWHEYTVPTPIVGLAWEQTGQLIVACKKDLFEVSGTGAKTLPFPLAAAEQVTWLGTVGTGPVCMVRAADDTVNKTTTYRRYVDGWNKMAVRTGVSFRAGPGREFMWPLLPDVTPPMGNSYGEYQNYGGVAYRHPGIDLLGDDNQPVFAVADGYVKAVLTTSGEWHWRVAVADQAVSERCFGWLYAHLDLSSIAVSVGDTVETGDYLGNLVPWPVADFTHLHFARIEHEGETWDGLWLCPSNPHLLMNTVAEDDVPFFEEANGTLVAFCENNSSAYLAPDSLFGAVDMVAHVGDRIKSDWVVCAQEIRYHVYPVERPEYPVINDKVAVYFDHSIDVYQGGTMDQLLVPILFKEDSVCPTAGDYSSREFYHIITNSDGDSIPELTDEAEAFNTALLPDGAYVVRLRALDVAGNTAVDSMAVTLANGNPDLLLRIQAVEDGLLLWWPRMIGASGYLVHRLPAPYTLTGGVFVAAVTDTFFLIDDALITSETGFYRVVATDGI